MTTITAADRLAPAIAQVLDLVETRWLSADAPAPVRDAVRRHFASVLRVVEAQPGYLIAYNTTRHGEDAFVICAETGSVTVVSGYLSPAAMVTDAIEAAPDAPALAAVPA